MSPPARPQGLLPHDAGRRLMPASEIDLHKIAPQSIDQKADDGRQARRPIRPAKPTLHEGDRYEISPDRSGTEE